MNFNITIVSKDENVNKKLIDQINTIQLHYGIEQNSISLDYNLIKFNTQPLTLIYNQLLNKCRMEKSYDFQIFIHADVNLDLLHLLNHIIECKEKYDIMGLCGTEVLNVSQKSLNWWNGSHTTPDKRWGSVIHGELNDHQSYFSSHSPDILDHHVACIDGLCIIFGPNAIYNSNILFDEQFKYHCYDTDISLQCLMKYGLKLGVLVELSLQHYSVGKGILTEDFKSQEKLLRTKWNFN